MSKGDLRFHLSHLLSLPVLVSALAVWFLSPVAIGTGLVPPPQSGSSTLSILGRDTWLPAGSSRILRITSSEDMFATGDTPVVSFSPGPIAVNYVTPATTRDLTVSITVPSTTPPGFQALTVTDGNLVQTLPDALRIVDSAIPNPSPAVLAPGTSAMLSIAPHSLFNGQTSFSLDLGPDVAVGPISLQPDGTLAVPVSVMNTALPGTRSVHLTAGPYALLAERGFAVDFGALVNTFHLVINGPYVGTLPIQLPAGYTAEVFYVANSTNNYQGLWGPDEMYVDPTNTLYVLNQGGTYFGPALRPMFISVFDLNPDNYGALKAVFTNIDSAGLGGLLESGTMLPSIPGKLFVSSEDYPNGGYPGGRAIYSVDTQTGASTLFYHPTWNFDPIAIDVNGNFVIGRDGPTSGGGGVTVLYPNGNLVKNCDVEMWPDLMTMDPLSGKFVINRPNVVYPTVGGAETVDLSDCRTAVLSDGPVLDGGSFGPPGGDFGNQFFVSDLGYNVFTLIPVAWNDLDQSVPGRAMPFARGFGNSDGVWFDRDGKHMLVADNVSLAIIDIQRDPNYQPNAPVANYQPNSLSFGSVVVGTSSAPQSVTLTNSGSAPLTFAAILASQDFTQSNTCGSSLAPGTDCTIPVTFTPTALGAKAGAVTITDSATGSPHTVALSGNGTDFTIAPAAGAPTSATVSSGGVADFHLALSGTSGFNGTVTLSCSKAPDYATCYLPPSVLLTDTNPVDVTVRVATTARGTIGPQHQPRSPMSNYRGFPFLVCLTLVLMAGLAGVAWAWRVAASKGLPSYPSARRASRRWRPAGALLFVVMLGTALMGGCGGSGTEERSGSTGTPAGTYTLEVTGQFATETSITTHDIELTLTVN